MTPRKGATIGEIERELLALGGSVGRGGSGHVVYTLPGLPAVAVHRPRTRPFCRAPKRLVSMLRKAQIGKVVTRPRVPVAVGEQSVETPKKRPKFSQRPNPPRPHAVGGAVDMEAIRAVVAEIERNKPRRRDREQVLDASLLRSVEQQEQFEELRRRIKIAPVIVGMGWPGIKGPTTLVWWGQDRLEECIRTKRPVRTLSVDVADWTPDLVDVMTRMVEEIKDAPADLRYSRDWTLSSVLDLLDDRPARRLPQTFSDICVTPPSTLIAQMVAVNAAALQEEAR